MSVEKRVRAYLELAREDLNAAEVLARFGNQYAAHHVQQGIEKLIKALLLNRSIEAGIEHRLENLADKLPEGDPWHERLEPFLHYSAYATAFRYPTPAGRIVGKPPGSEVLRDVDAIRSPVDSCSDSEG